MASEDMIRRLIDQTKGWASAPSENIGEAMRLYESAAQNDAQCRMRNLRGECANPNLLGEDGAMSWREYDALKAQGKDPEEISFNNLNKPRPWQRGPASLRPLANP